jgi:SWI/SNF-related matrix-associated actin-dependent regulator of chromatin subfamily A3
VKTVKMIMEDSIETRLLEVQARKLELAKVTLGTPLSKAEVQARRLEELNQLFAN